jgi:hypothetical protein
LGIIRSLHQQMEQKAGAGARKVLLIFIRIAETVKRIV